jgi:predicted DsbA family dithiol-disulfide isomerase
MEQNSTAEQTPVVVEMWADLGCPWCYVGKHRLQRAIEGRPDAAASR